MTAWYSPKMTFSKRVIEAGIPGHRPIELSNCSVLLESQAELGKYWLHEDNYPLGQVGSDSSVDVTVGLLAHTPFNCVIHECLLTMNEREICEVYINADGSKFTEPISPNEPPSGGSSPKRPRNDDENHARDPQVCKVKVTLTALTDKGTEVFDLIPDEKLTRAQTLKEQGNELFKSGHVELAFNKFGRALKYLVCVGKPGNISEELSSTSRSLKTTCHLNLAACQAQKANNAGVIANCTKALSVEPENVKALYRRGQAYAKLEDFPNAKEDLRKAHELDPNNKAVEKLLNNVKETERVQERKLASAMSKMFS